MISILGATTLALTGVLSDCAGSKTTLLPEEHGGMIIDETGRVHRVLEKKNEKKKDTHDLKQIGNKYVSCFSIRVLGGRVTIYSMLYVLLFFNFRVWADKIYRGIIRSRPICLPRNGCLIYIIHQRRTAVCATQKSVLKSELMTRYVENKDDDVAKRAALLVCFQKGGF